MKSAQARANSQRASSSIFRVCHWPWASRTASGVWADGRRFSLSICRHRSFQNVSCALDGFLGLVEVDQDFAFAGVDFLLNACLKVGGGFLLGKQLVAGQFLEALLVGQGRPLALLALRLQHCKPADDFTLKSGLPPFWRPPTPVLLGGG